jgi:hypothetical protein
MGKLHRKVMRVLRASFKDVQDALDDVPSTGRITGAIISSYFDRMDHSQRQRRLESALKKGLTAEEYAHVGPIVVLTRREADVKVI